MIRMMESANWNTTNPLRKKVLAQPNCNFPFNTRTGLSDEKKMQDNFLLPRRLIIKGRQ